MERPSNAHLTLDKSLGFVHWLYPRKSRGCFIGILIIRGSTGVIYRPEPVYRKPAEIGTDVHSHSVDRLTIN